MKKSTSVLIALIMYGTLCMAGIDMANAGGDFPNEKAARDYAKQQAEEQYLQVTGMKATSANVIHSLKVENECGKKNSEVSAALDVVILYSDVYTAIFDVLVACYEQNKSERIRYRCVIALASYDEVKAKKLANAMLADDETSLSWKLLVTRWLVRRGCLSGYPNVKKGLASTRMTSRRIAVALIDYFEQYDGQVYGEGDKRVNVQELKYIASQQNDAEKSDDVRVIIRHSEGQEE